MKSVNMTVSLLAGTLVISPMIVAESITEEKVPVAENSSETFSQKTIVCIDEITGEMTTNCETFGGVPDGQQGFIGVLPRPPEQFEEKITEETGVSVVVGKTFQHNMSVTVDDQGQISTSCDTPSHSIENHKEHSHVEK